MSSLIYFYAKSYYVSPDILESQKLTIDLLTEYFSYFILILVTISIGTLLASWVYFYFIKNNSSASFLKIQIGDNHTAPTAGQIPFLLKINSTIRPLLGTLKARVVFDKLQLSNELQLNQDSHDHSVLIRSGVYSSQFLDLQEIKNHKTQKVILYFEDMFRLFSLPQMVYFEKSFYTSPPATYIKDTSIAPNKSIEQNIRIDIPQKTQGELLNYKTFESGDDIRRIVWKIYAKNKELVIRNPEIVNPYASDIEVFVSFYNTLKKQETDPIQEYLLNQYKIKLRAIYEVLKKQGFDLKFSPDQHIEATMEQSGDDSILYPVSVAKWQNELSLLEYTHFKKGGVLCISSFSSPEEIAQLLQGTHIHYTIFYSKLSSVYANQLPFSVKQLFVRSKESIHTLNKRRWLFSRIRSKVVQNENEIEKILKESTLQVYFC
ncbi:MAG: hypothetical protein U0V72_08350 [Cytophagales bacterium]